MLDIPEKVKQLCYIRRITCTRQMIFIRRMQALRGLRSLVNR